VTDEESDAVVEEAASEERIANLEGELKEAADQEAETAQRFDSERWRRAALDQELHEAREEAARLMLDEASQTSSAIRAEAVELLQATRVQAEREAGRVTKHAFEQANEMIAIARREAVAIVNAGRDEVRALEDDAARRMADLENRAREAEAISERIGRVLSSGKAVESADPEEVDARLRNLSHGTNSK
jgi:hypothetical protein